MLILCGRSHLIVKDRRENEDKCVCSAVMKARFDPEEVSVPDWSSNSGLFTFCATLTSNSVSFSEWRWKELLHFITDVCHLLMKHETCMFYFLSCGGIQTEPLTRQLSPCAFMLIFKVTSSLCCSCCTQRRHYYLIVAWQAAGCSGLEQSAY